MEDSPHAQRSCLFCNVASEDNEDLGQLLHKGSITVHQNCMYFSSGLSQNGDTDNGLSGFTEEDIRVEVARGVGPYKMCYRCGKTGNYIGCAKSQCKKAGHLPCVIKSEFLLQFFDKFKVYCPAHRPKQSFTPPTDSSSSAPYSCPICLSNFPSPLRRTLPFSILLTPCCNWLCHRACIQRQARSAGEHYFRCPICNNQDQFNTEMRLMGIEIPSRDASWEVGDQFSDIHDPTACCNLPCCRNREGRRCHSEDNKIIDCVWCGQCIGHLNCIRPYLGDPEIVIVTDTGSGEGFICRDCIPVYNRKRSHIEVEDSTPSSLMNFEIDLKIESALTLKAGSIQPMGIVFIFGIAGVKGTQVDVQHVYRAFYGKFNFAVLIEENLTCKELAMYIDAAATYKYPSSCKSRVFYFAGHGGIDKNQQPFFYAIGTEELKSLSVQQHILAPFKSIRGSDSLIFLFDCCLNMVGDGEYDPNAAPFAFDIPPQCLVAFATSPGKKSWGDNLKGGAWTNRLCENLEKLRTGDTLTSALDATNDAVMKNSESAQPPQYHSCTGPVYLKGPNAFELDRLFRAFSSHKADLLHLLRDDNYTLISLTAVLCSEKIIDKSVKSSVLQKKGWKGCSFLLDELEKSCNAKPDNIRPVLKNMEDESLLSSLIKKIREDAASKSKFDRKTYAELLASLNEQEEEMKALIKENKQLKKKLKTATELLASLNEREEALIKKNKELKKSLKTATGQQTMSSYPQKGTYSQSHSGYGGIGSYSGGAGSYNYTDQSYSSYGDQSGGGASYSRGGLSTQSRASSTYQGYGR